MPTLPYTDLLGTYLLLYYYLCSSHTKITNKQLDFIAYVIALLLIILVTTFFVCDADEPACPQR